jgi:hypothetical protein
MAPGASVDILDAHLAKDFFEDPDIRADLKKGSQTGGVDLEALRPDGEALYRDAINECTAALQAFIAQDLGNSKPIDVNVSLIRHKENPDGPVDEIAPRGCASVVFAHWQPVLASGPDKGGGGFPIGRPVFLDERCGLKYSMPSVYPYQLFSDMAVLVNDIGVQQSRLYRAECPPAMVPTRHPSIIKWSTPPLNAASAPPCPGAASPPVVPLHPLQPATFKTTQRAT